MTIAGMIFGGSPNSRLFQRIRVKDGLSYGATAGFSMPTKDDGGRLFGSAIAAPQNMPKVEADFNEELARALKDGFTADEVEKAKKTWLDERAVARAEEASIAGLLMARERWGRTLEWDAKTGGRRGRADTGNRSTKRSSATSIRPPSPSSRAATSRKRRCTSRPP